MRTGQDFTVGRGEERLIRFRVAGGAGATDAQWYCGAGPDTHAGEHDLALTTTDGGVALADEGPDVLADLSLTGVATKTLPLGKRWHELWVTVGGRSARRATGWVTVEDTLKA